MIALALAIVSGSFISGYRYRDARCDAAESKVEASTAKAETKAVTEARTNDHATSEAVAKIEEQHAQQDQTREVVFQTIEKEVIRYVQSPPVVGGCTVDPDFVRIWSAASAGTVPGAEPGHPSDAAGRVP
ncbi:MAG TPA: hypothetical protein VJM50_23790 [Pyrinomonadaceae bacterium]|nr:hypothetical protein [Pyrinomonadaceae bacterium]